MNSRNHLTQYILQSLGPIMYTKTCLYTMTPDRHFVVDDCSKYGWNNVIVCCGAGHAFKCVLLYIIHCCNCNHAL